MVDDDAREELLAIVRARSFKIGNFTLSSGKTSTLYFNMKPTMLDPRGAELSARALLAIAREARAEYVSGLEMGAVPVIGSMAAIGAADGAPVRATFVRKAVKAHGSMDRIEGLGPGESLAGKRVLVIDDVATTGASTLAAIEAIRGAGGIVDTAAALVDREEGGEALLAQHGVRLLSVLRASEVAATASHRSG